MNIELKSIRSAAIKLLRLLIRVLGLTFLLMLLLSFTDLPYYAYYYLGTSFPVEEEQPDVIVVMGGSGMPSADGLIRVYYAAELAAEFQDAPVILALPRNETDSTRQLDLMARELVLKGTDPGRIRYEPEGYNTWTQAVNVAALYNGRLERTKVLIISSPEHIYRSVKCFKKAGFEKVFGFPAFEQPSDEDSLRDRKKAKQIRPTLDLRYNLWSYLNYELLVFREYLAISYYKVRGWI